MSKVSVTRDSVSPQSPQERDAILRELENIAESPYFCNSRRYPTLLRYIVENALAGNAAHLKERTIGISVFDRPPTYDTNADTIVRYSAGEVRKRLLLYYSEHQSESGIRISLPPGSYVPEFLLESDTLEHAAAQDPDPIQAEPALSPIASVAAVPHPAGLDHPLPAEPVDHPPERIWSRQLVIGAGVSGAGVSLALMVLVAFLAMRIHSRPTDAVVADFWAPVLRNQAVINICAGGVVFQNNDFSGVITAGKDAEYTFVSMQAAAAIGQISALADHSGASTRLLPSPTTQVSDLRDHPVILVGAYNNRWTMRLLRSARYQFTAEPDESIIDQRQPQVRWTRDRSHHYGNAEDYAVIARFHDATTGQWVIALAGLGRNGTEGAALFATAPHDLQMLQHSVGIPFSSNKNIAAVLKVHVIDGKTGATSIEAAQVW